METFRPGVYSWSKKCATKTSNRKRAEWYLYKKEHKSHYHQRIRQIGDSDYHYDFDGDYDLFGWYDIQCGDH
jgi:hypothetical protein